MNLDIVEFIISKIEGKIVEPSIDLIKSFLESLEYDTFEIFKYLQSIYSCYENTSIYIIYPLAYSIGFNNPQIKKCLKADFKVIVLDTLQELKVEDNIEYYNINKNFLKYFNGLLNLKEEKKEKRECYNYLCEFKKNNSCFIKLKFDECFHYFSLIKIEIQN